MEAHTDAQTVNLSQLEQGQYMTIIITGATAHGGSVALEFQNANDPNWTPDPNFVGTLDGSGNLIERVKCLSSKTRLVFSADPAGTKCWISTVYDVVSNF